VDDSTAIRIPRQLPREMIPATPRADEQLVELLAMVLLKVATQTDASPEEGASALGCEDLQVVEEALWVRKALTRQFSLSGVPVFPSLLRRDFIGVVNLYSKRPNRVIRPTTKEDLSIPFAMLVDYLDALAVEGGQG